MLTPKQKQAIKTCEKIRKYKTRWRVSPDPDHPDNVVMAVGQGRRRVMHHIDALKLVRRTSRAYKRRRPPPKPKRRKRIKRLWRVYVKPIMEV